MIPSLPLCLLQHQGCLLRGLILLFPHARSETKAGYITLQGWLAQWSMTTFEEPKQL